MATVSERVEAGAALLDKEVPGWHRVINLDELTLSSCEACVCGQVGRAIGYGLIKTRARKHNIRRATRFNGMLNFLRERLKLADDGVAFIEVAEAYGFDRYGKVTYQRLDREWQRIIRGRLEAEAAA
jgi:hypothetical protein